MNEGINKSPLSHDILNDKNNDLKKKNVKKLEYEDNSYYEGQIEGDNIKHGIGKYQFSDITYFPLYCNPKQPYHQMME